MQISACKLSVAIVMALLRLCAHETFTDYSKQIIIILLSSFSYWLLSIIGGATLIFEVELLKIDRRDDL